MAGVATGAAAAGARVQAGDVIARGNGRGVEDADHAIALVRARRGGDTVRLTVMRGKTELRFEVALGPRSGEAK